jgi:hypothetical protein
MNISIFNRSVLNEPTFLAASRMCLASAGDGYGMRLSSSVSANCVPLIAQPSIVQPFEDLLDYRTFSWRLSSGDIPTLARALQQLEDSTLLRMRKNLAAAHPAFSWAEDGLAYNLTVLSLCWRAMHLRRGLKAGRHALTCESMARRLPILQAHARPHHPHWFTRDLVTIVEGLRRHRTRCMLAASSSLSPPRGSTCLYS